MFNSSLFYYLTCYKGKCFSNQIIGDIWMEFNLVLPIADLVKQRFFQLSIYIFKNFIKRLQGRD